MPPKNSRHPSIAARIERLPLASFHRRFVALVALGGWFDFYDIFMMAYIGAALQADGFLTREAFGWVIAAGFLGMFLGAAVFGLASDRYGRRRSFLVMLLIYSGFTIAGAFSQDMWVLLACRFLSGLGIGAELVVIDTYVSEIVPSRARGRYVAITQVVGFTAIPVVALLAKLLIPYHAIWEGWRWVMVIGGGGALFVWYLRRRLPESPRWLEMAGRVDEADAILRTVEAEVERETGRPLAKPAALAVAEERGNLRELLDRAYRRRTLLLTAFHLLQTVGIYGFANWAPTFLLAQGKSLGQSLDYSFWIALMSPLGPLVAVFTTERWQRKHAIVVLASLMAISGMTFPFANSALAIVAAGALLTFFSFWFSAVLHAYQAELFPTRIRATGVGFTYSVSRLSVILSSPIIAWLLGYNVLSVFIFMAGAMLGVALLIGLLGPRTNAALLEEVSA